MAPEEIHVVRGQVDPRAVLQRLPALAVFPTIVFEEFPTRVPADLFAEQARAGLLELPHERPEPVGLHDPTLFLEEKIDIEERAGAPPVFPGADVEACILPVKDLDTGISGRKTKESRHGLVYHKPELEGIARGSVADLIEKRDELVSLADVVMRDYDQYRGVRDFERWKGQD
jgi:hypothetical protein